MTWREVEEYVKSNDTMLFPLGSIHSRDHVGIGIDTESATVLAERVGERTGTVVLPSLNFAWMESCSDFPGTISVRTETLRDLVLQVVEQVGKWGVKKVVFINGHDKNHFYLEEVGVKMRQMGMYGPILEWWEIIRQVYKHLEIEAQQESGENTITSGIRSIRGQP